MPPIVKKKTKTSSFGVSGRYGHDSSKFYNSNLYSNISTKSDIRLIDNPIALELLNKIYFSNNNI